MSIISTEDVGFGLPLRVTLRVSAIGSTDAVEQAKTEARAAGYRVRTLGRVSPSLDWDRDPRHDRMDWLVELVARPSS